MVADVRRDVCFLLAIRSYKIAVRLGICATATFQRMLHRRPANYCGHVALMATARGCLIPEPADE